MQKLGRYKTISQEKVGEFDMVSFFKMPPPDTISDALIRIPNESKYPFYMTRANFESCSDFRTESAKECTFNTEILKYSGALYLFTGSIQLYEVTIHDILDDLNRNPKDGYRLKLVIRTFAGDYWGTIWYDYMYYRCKDGRLAKVVNNLREGRLFTTVEPLTRDKYVVFVDYDAEISTKSETDITDDYGGSRYKVALGMQLYQGDKEKFEQLLTEYEQSLQSLAQSRGIDFTYLQNINRSDDDLPSSIDSFADADSMMNQSINSDEIDESDESDVSDLSNKDTQNNDNDSNEGYESNESDGSILLNEGNGSDESSIDEHKSLAEHHSNVSSLTDMLR